MRKSVLAALLLTAICGTPTSASPSLKHKKTNTPTLQGQQALPPQLTQEDTAVIAEAYHLWKSLGEKI